MICAIAGAQRNIFGRGPHPIKITPGFGIQAAFWKFATAKWENIEIKEDNVQALALAAASDFLEARAAAKE